MGTPIDQSIWLDIHGDRQNIRIVTEDCDHPIMLFLHGGPGLCDRHTWLSKHRALSHSYTPHLEEPEKWELELHSFLCELQGATT